MRDPAFDRSPRSPFAGHGGALDDARRLYPAAPEPWIDLSTGINPWPYAIATVPSDAWTRLPDSGALDALEGAAARLYGAPAGVGVVAAPGTQAIIQRLPDRLGGADVRTLGHTYGEYGRVFSGAGVTRAATLADLAGADVAIVVNPNNPDGRLIMAEALAALSPRVGALVVDEAFMDALEPGRSLIPRLPPRRALVLRSFGKFFGLAGLRLGFAVGDPALVAALREALGPWAVGGPALAIGTRALADTAWHAATRARLGQAAMRLDMLLRGAGIEVIGGTPLFRLARAGALFEPLARSGILTRPFADEPSWLRLGLPGTEDAWTRLRRGLEQL